MVRDSRIKELILGDNGNWSGATLFNAANSGVTIHSKSINGEILSVDLNFDRAGSMALSISGTGIEFWRSNASSGATWLHSQPREFTQSTTGSIAGAEHVPFIVNGPIVLNTGSLASGTIPLQLQLRYR